MSKQFELNHIDRDEARRQLAAADWLQRVQDDAVPEDVLLDWIRWCEADPRNQRAFDRAQEIWDLVDRLRPELVDGELPGALVKPPVLPTPTVGERVENTATQILAGLFRPAFAVAALLALVATVLIQLGEEQQPPPIASNGGVVLTGPTLAAAAPRATELAVAQPQARPATEFVRETRLADGSAVQLATGSAVAVKFDAHQRGMELQNGEAYFTVAPEKSRPFVVAAGAVSIRAIGTAFNVRRAGERVVVSVTEGTVDVVGAMRGSEPIQLSAGSQLRWDGAGGHPVLVPITAKEVLGWRQGRLAYTNEPLGAVIADFNRYSDKPARIGDDVLWHIRFSGTLFTRSSRDWLLGLPAAFPLRVVVTERAYLLLPGSEQETSG